MRKLRSLIKACMSDNMSLFKIKSKNKNQASKIVLPIFLAIVLFSAIWFYASIMIEPLAEVHLEYVLLTIFVMLTSILTLIEGIYKSSNLLFNCKDDNLLLALPIKKSTVLFVRIFKFYIFELAYNALFLLPAMIVYTLYVEVNITYYLISLVMILLLPIIPIVISCIIGGIISLSSTKFKFKNVAQIVITTLVLLIVFYISFNIENILRDLAQNAKSINDIITKLYYPAGAYNKMILNFNVNDLIIFIAFHILLCMITILSLSKIYYKINSNVKTIKTGDKNKKYKIKTNKPLKSLIKKELNKFISSPVFVTNAGFGLVLFIIGCILVCIKADSITEILSMQGIDITFSQVEVYMPVILFGFICFSSFMTSITSSMISLEGRTFNILKSLPISPFKIIFSKVLTAVLIMFPFLVIGDIIVFIKFNFKLIEILIILLTSIILPCVAETIGILINLKYPKMNATNDTEVVKQSMSSTVSVFTGIILSILTISVLVGSVESNMNIDLIIMNGLAIYTIIFIGLLIYLNKKSVKEFNKINV